MKIKTKVKVRDLIEALSHKEYVKLVDAKGLDATVHIEIETDNRSVAQNAKYWKELALFCENVPEPMLELFYSYLLSDLKVNGMISTKMMHEFLKQQYGIKSTSFSNLPKSSDASDYITWAIEELKRYINLLKEY